MTGTENGAGQAASLEEVREGWHGLASRVGQLEAEKSALEQENKSLRFLLERMIEHRQKSHSELVLLLTGLVSKLPLNDVGVIVTKLVEHNTNVNQALAALVKGTADAHLPQPVVLQTLDQAKRDLLAALKPVVEELTRLDTPLEEPVLRSLAEQPGLFFSPRVVRANRCFVKGQVPRERIVRDFGEEALVFFNDMTTDPKLNPRPKTEEIVLGFRNDFEALFQQNPTLLGEKRQELIALYQRVLKSKAPTDQGRLQKTAFARLSFVIELLHYYENQAIEAPDLVFAQRLPALIEQLVITGPQDNLDEKLILQAEALLALVINPDHRLMIINNVGKAGGAAKTLKYVLRLRNDQALDADHVVGELIRHLVPPPPQAQPGPEALAAVLRLVKPERQRSLVKAILAYDRIRKQEAETLGRAVGAALGLKGIEQEAAAQPALPPEVERQVAWGKIKELIAQRNDPAVIAGAIRDRLRAKYDAEEVKQSWITLIDADAISLIRIFCQLPYCPDGKTDPIAQTVMETYVTRLTHEKYSAAYAKVANSLKNMFKAKPDSPTLLNFMALVKWVSPEAANKLSHDTGVAIPAR
jgi:hypothetical protein